MCMGLRFLAALTALVFVGGVIRAEDAYYSVRVREMKLEGGKLPGGWNEQRRLAAERWKAMQPCVRLAGEGEAYLVLGDGEIRPSSGSVLADASVAIRAEQGKGVAGRLFVPKSDWSGMLALRFAVPASAASPKARAQFYRAKKAHYERLLKAGFPGGAWFRHQAREAQLAAEGKAAERPAAVRGPSATDLSRSYELFSGGRAISENLQLDRELELRLPDQQKVPLEKLQGVTVPEIQWAPLVSGLHPEFDPLAACIPADQHAVFFASFQEALRVGDEAAGYGLSVFRLAEPRAEDARTEDRYQRQLCLPTTTLARLLGPHVAKSVAVTGSDTYFPTGTDLAVLFEAPQPALLENLLWARITLAASQDKEAKRVEGRVGRIAYQGFRSPDRRICSYLARTSRAIVVTNSLAQLERLAAVDEARAPSIAGLPEYTFFRNRYRRGEAQESAFVLISDATIRRWCGPRWRIMNSRRTRDAAVLAELQAAHLDAIVRGKPAAGPIRAELPLSQGGELTLGRGGVLSPVLGGLEFMTPIADIPLSEVTLSEAEAYRRWREEYERLWTRRFDPIALRLSVRKEKLAADLTVMPLSGGSELQGFANFSGPVIAPESGDRHGALVHLIVGLPEGLSNVLGATKDSPRSYVEIFVDESPFWQELAKTDARDLDRFMKQNWQRVPAAIRLGPAKSPLRDSVRTELVERMQASRREPLRYREQAYIRLVNSRLLGDDASTLYFAELDDGLIATLDEDVLKRAIDRQIARRKAKAEGKPPAADPHPWLSTHMGLQVRREGLEAISLLAAGEFQAAMQRSAWGNLPILNQWKRLYPDRDPVEIHRQVWHAEPVCPGGGRYVWNAQWQTMESTVYGHPGQPKAGPPAPPVVSGLRFANFGLNFDDRSLRAAMVLERRAAEPRP